MLFSVMSGCIGAILAGWAAFFTIKYLEERGKNISDMLQIQRQEQQDRLRGRQKQQVQYHCNMVCAIRREFEVDKLKLLCKRFVDGDMTELEFRQALVIPIQYGGLDKVGLIALAQHISKWPLREEVRPVGREET